MFHEFEFLGQVTSTNDYLKSYVADGRARAVVADHQTAGRGQYGKGWVSPAKEGLYVSYLFFPNWQTRYSPYLNVTSSLAVLQTIRDIAGSQFQVVLKRPNDILVGHRKIGGILCELGTNDNLIEWAIIGIGVNLYQKEFPAELQNVATSLLLEGVRVPSRDRFLELQTSYLIGRIELAQTGGWTDLNREYESQMR